MTSLRRTHRPAARASRGPGSCRRVLLLQQRRPRRRTLSVGGRRARGHRRLGRPSRNGTQSCFYERSDVLTISLHMRHGSWDHRIPRRVHPSEAGTGKGAGHNINGVEARKRRRRLCRCLPACRAARAPRVPAGGAHRRQRPRCERVRRQREDEREHGRSTPSGAGMRRSAARRRGPGARPGGRYARTYAAYCLHATSRGAGNRPAAEGSDRLPAGRSGARERRHRRGVLGAPKLGPPLTRELPFAEAEYRDRVRRVRQEMDRRDVDVLFVMSPANLCYLTGFESIWYPPRAPLGVVVSRRDERLVFLDYERHETLVRQTAFSTTASSSLRGRAGHDRARVSGPWLALGKRRDRVVDADAGCTPRARDSGASGSAGSAHRRRRLDRRPGESREDGGGARVRTPRSRDRRCSVRGPPRACARARPSCRSRRASTP